MNAEKNLTLLPHHRRWALSALGALCLAGLAGCATPAGDATVADTRSPEDIVRERAQQRLDALVAGDFRKAYTFAAPGYRALKSAEYYEIQRRSLPAQWVSARLLRVECEQTLCRTTAALETRLRIPVRFSGTLNSALDETWVYEDGQWWAFESL